MNVQEKVISILEEQLDLPKGEVLLTSTKESLCKDSLDEIEIIISLEDEFDIEISNYQASKFKSVQDIVDFIHAKQVYNRMSNKAYKEAKEVFEEDFKGKTLQELAGQPYQLSTGEIIEVVIPSIIKCEKITGTLDLGDEWKEDLYNPVKDISYEKYLRCTHKLPAKIFNSDQGCLWMYKSSCGKYYYWSEYNSKNKVIYRRGEVDWVESNYEDLFLKEENIADFTEKFSNMVSTLDSTKRVKLEGTIKDKRNTLLKDLKTEWTDKHYDFNYTLTEDDIEKGAIKIDPYFVAKQWKLGSKDDSGALWHTFKGIARFGEKNSVEREIRAFHAQIKRLAELNGVDLDG